MSGLVLGTRDRNDKDQGSCFDGIYILKEETDNFKKQRF